MARYFDVHPDNPQPRSMRQVVELVRDGGVIAYPTDSCFALGCEMGNRAGLDRIREIRRLDDRHHFTLVCRDFAQLGQLVHVSNSVFRLVKAATPGSDTLQRPLAQQRVPKRGGELVDRGRPAVFCKIKATRHRHRGIMSHAAIVCREYGRPAEVGTGSGSTTIKTGNLIRVDGEVGRVEIF